MTENKNNQDKEKQPPGEDEVSELLAREGRGLYGFQLSACMHCGICADSCHIYKAEPTIANIPAVKAALVSKMYRQRHTLLGKLLAKFSRHIPLEDQVKQLSEHSYGRCTACGRCSEVCPMGINIRDIIRTGRRVCATMDEVPQGLVSTLKNQLETGNQMAIPADEIKSTCGWLAEDLRMETGDESISLPVDEKGKRIMFLVNPREIKFFPLSLMGAAAVFHAAGESWTISSRFPDVTNYAFFKADDPAGKILVQNIIEEAQALGVEEIILSECGHGFQAFIWEGPKWFGKAYPLKARSVLELYVEFVKSGRIKLDPSKNTDRVTLHDPCNLVRLGGVEEPQRFLLKAACSDFVEMTPNRRDNYCCGGGGGMLSMSEFGKRRVASGRIKAEQIKATGAKIVATPCHNCADQLIEINKTYKLGVEIMNIAELLHEALVIPEKNTSE